MTTPALEGFAYRRAPVDRATILQLAAGLLPGPVWSFGGAAQWDFDPARGRDNLRAVRQLAALGPNELRGDFGHCFTAEGELRWRRLDDDRYDLLVLCECPLTDAERVRLGLRTIGRFHATATPEEGGILIEAGHARLGVVEYRDPASRALRLVRYTRRVEVATGANDERA